MGVASVRRRPSTPPSQSVGMISSDFFLIAFLFCPLHKQLVAHTLSSSTLQVHAEKRRRWGSQLLKSLSQSSLNAWETEPSKMMADITGEGHLRHIWTDERLVRTVLSVSLPMEGYADRPDKEGLWIAECLGGLHALAGCIMPYCDSTEGNWMNLHRAISDLIRSADDLSENMPLRVAVASFSVCS